MTTNFEFESYNATRQTEEADGEFTTVETTQEQRRAEQDADDDDDDVDWRAVTQEWAHEARTWVASHPFAALGIAVATGFVAGRIVRR